MADLPNEIKKNIACAVNIIRNSKRAVVLTGAGISTPSGIPDFRSGGEGLWTRYDPFEVASLISFRYHPEKFYDWIRPLAVKIRKAEPNAAHYSLAKLEQAGLLKATITQNIDGLHQRAGSRTVIEVHGSLETMTCVDCYDKADARDFIKPYFENGQVPHCPACGGVLKPDVVLFGEQLPVYSWLQAQKTSKNCDVMLVAGSSLEVLPVAGLPMNTLESGGHLIVINQSDTYIDVRADVVFHENVVDILPIIAAGVLNG
jgi:NAD-dependent deacetylase